MYAQHLYSLYFAEGMLLIKGFDRMIIVASDTFLEVQEIRLMLALWLHHSTPHLKRMETQVYSDGKLYLTKIGLKC